jgi:pilus assembly protein CpaB
VVKITRGQSQSTTETPVSAKASSGAILSGQQSGVRRAGQTVPVAGATVIK